MKDEILNKYEPVMNIVVYKSQLDDHYCEFAKVKKDKSGKYTTTEAKPLKKSTLINLAKAVNEKRTSRITGYVNGNILYLDSSPDNDILAWYRPEQVSSLFFKDELKIPSGKAYIPPLIFVVKKKHISVYAVRCLTRPELDEPLYRAPFHNVSDNGSVCMGSSKINNANTIEEVIQQYEYSFFNSVFTHLSGDRSPINGNLNLLWKELIQSQEKFPAAVLKLSPHKTVKQLLAYL